MLIFATMSRSLYPLLDRLAGGTLAQRLTEWRSEGLSYDEIARRVADLTGEVVNGDSIRRWCIEQGIGSAA
jgi:hypothetical protein